MACKGFEKRLIEEALAPGADPGLTAHLASCEACREYLAFQRALQESITGGVAVLVADEPSPALLVRVREQIAAESAPRAARWMNWAVAGAAVAALAAFALWFAGRPSLLGRAPENGPVQSSRSASFQPVILPQAANVPPPVVIAHEHAARAARSRTPQRGTAVRRVIQAASVQLPSDAQPKILIPPGQREAVMRLVNALRSGRVDAASLIQPPPPPGDFAPLEIVPLKIAPIDERQTDKAPDGDHNYHN